MSREEEYELALKAQKGDKIARDKIVTSNLRFVVSVAKKYQNRGIEFIDLISEGNIGLLTAIEKFDPEKGYHFISYAVWWIRQSILKAIYEKSRMIRLPSNKTNELIQIEAARRAIKKTMSEEEYYNYLISDNYNDNLRNELFEIEPNENNDRLGSYALRNFFALLLRVYIPIPKIFKYIHSSHLHHKNKLPYR